ncbi:hypothetical protein KSS87_003892 [Heliosperma pusillum]|nr:hypothetical protein KSS87_003892 [Heliosperma pusillum]
MIEGSESSYLKTHWLPYICFNHEDPMFKEAFFNGEFTPDLSIRVANISSTGVLSAKESSDTSAFVDAETDHANTSIDIEELDRLLETDRQTGDG